MNIDLLKLFLISCVITPHVHVFPDIHVKKSTIGKQGFFHHDPLLIFLFK